MVAVRRGYRTAGERGYKLMLLLTSSGDHVSGRNDAMSTVLDSPLAERRVVSFHEKPFTIANATVAAECSPAAIVALAPL